MPITSNFTSVFSKEWEIDFTQCTPNGYLKYTDLCNILQLTAGDHAAMGGISFTEMQQFNQAWVLSRMRVEINELPQWRDIVTVKTWIVSLENSRSVRGLEMYIGNKKIIGCETFWAVFNTKTRRPEALALPYDHFELYPENHPTLQRVKRIAFSGESTSVKQRTVLLSDLDIVNHVNNVKYLEWCLDLIAPELVLSGKLRSFDMNFMRELALADDVSIVNNALVFSIVKENIACFALQLDWE